MTKTEQERLIVLEQKVDVLDEKIEQNFKESKQFYVQLLRKLEKLDNEKITVARLQERVKNLERYTGAVGLAAIGAAVQAIFNII
jgi:hypothetical protein